MHRQTRNGQKTSVRYETPADTIFSLHATTPPKETRRAGRPSQLVVGLDRTGLNLLGGVMKRLTPAPNLHKNRTDRMPPSPTDAHVIRS